jgi:NAD(P)H-hydrate epimerase
MAEKISFLGAAESQQIDNELFALGFNNDQLMELAGLAVATAVQKVYPAETHQNILVVAGPGNNGGDALVAARHLAHFGYTPKIFYPKRPDKAPFKNLLQQCEAMHIEAIKDLPDALKDHFQLVLDGIFGYSFKGDIRAPFDTLIPTLNKSGVPIVAIDIPSGWDVEEGDKQGRGLNAAMLISLTLPKKGVKDFKNVHYLGGRFVSKILAEKHKLIIPPYPGSDQVVNISKL